MTIFPAWGILAWALGSGVSGTHLTATDTVVKAAVADTAVNVHARHMHRVRLHMDSVLDRRDSQARHDTTYMNRSPKGLRLRVSLNASGTVFDVEGSNAAGSYTSKLEAQNKYTVSFSASYRGVTAGLAVNPAKLAGKNTDYASSG